MFSKDNNFQLSRQCEMTDFDCWRGQLQKSIKCAKDDKECWGALLPKLPCDI